MGRFFTYAFPMNRDTLKTKRQRDEGIIDIVACVEYGLITLGVCVLIPLCVYALKAPVLWLYCVGLVGELLIQYVIIRRMPMLIATRCYAPIVLLQCVIALIFPLGTIVAYFAILHLFNAIKSPELPPLPIAQL